MNDHTGPASIDQLRRLWWLLVDALLAYLENTPAEKRRASMLDVIRAFLKDKGVSLETLQTENDMHEALRSISALKLPFGGTND